jgi:hypothetical protein
MFASHDGRGTRAPEGKPLAARGPSIKRNEGKKWRTHSRSKHQDGIQATQVAVNAMIRARDEGKPCVSCGNMRKLEAGHFRISNHGTKRFHPMNLSGQRATCNRFAGGVTYEYSIELDRGHPNDGQSDEIWGCGISDQAFPGSGSR